MKKRESQLQDEEKKIILQHDSPSSTISKKENLIRFLRIMLIDPKAISLLVEQEGIDSFEKFCSFQIQEKEKEREFREKFGEEGKESLEGVVHGFRMSVLFLQSLLSAERGGISLDEFSCGWHGEVFVWAFMNSLLDLCPYFTQKRCKTFHQLSILPIPRFLGSLPSLSPPEREAIASHLRNFQFLYEQKVKMFEGREVDPSLGEVQIWLRSNDFLDLCWVFSSQDCKSFQQLSSLNLKKFLPLVPKEREKELEKKLISFQESYPRIHHLIDSTSPRLSLDAISLTHSSPLYGVPKGNPLQAISPPPSSSLLSSSSQSPPFNPPGLVPRRNSKPSRSPPTPSSSSSSSSTTFFVPSPSLSPSTTPSPPGLSRQINPRTSPNPLSFSTSSLPLMNHPLPRGIPSSSSSSALSSHSHSHVKKEKYKRVRSPEMFEEEKKEEEEMKSVEVSAWLRTNNLEDLYPIFEKEGFQNFDELATLKLGLFVEKIPQEHRERVCEIVRTFQKSYSQLILLSEKMCTMPNPDKTSNKMKRNSTFLEMNFFRSSSTGKKKKKEEKGKEKIKKERRKRTISGKAKRESALKVESHFAEKKGTIARLDLKTVRRRSDGLLSPPLTSAHNKQNQKEEEKEKEKEKDPETVRAEREKRQQEIEAFSTFVMHLDEGNLSQIDINSTFVISIEDKKEERRAEGERTRRGEKTERRKSLPGMYREPEKWEKGLVALNEGVFDSENMSEEAFRRMRRKTKLSAQEVFGGSP